MEKRSCLLVLSTFFMAGCGRVRIQVGHVVGEGTFPIADEKLCGMVDRNGDCLKVYQLHNKANRKYGETAKTLLYGKLEIELFVLSVLLSATSYSDSSRHPLSKSKNMHHMQTLMDNLNV
ncbi:hypothetical protein CDAR_461091 [Caerostris darwini]|uniref:Uncharacterized protein n=1 Tax=Caerostris darwini TaxID=1538125 RepID=A0AAV4W0C2_9ARAC|nr:hypothetical protein CDAR_461091 [Caerostris darwini]